MKVSPMNTTSRLLVLSAVIAIPLVAFFFWRQPSEGPAERAGSALDNAVQEMQDAVDPPGPMEKAGRSMDKAIR